MNVHRTAAWLAAVAVSISAHAAEDAGWRLATRADLPDAVVSPAGEPAPGGSILPDGRWAFIDPVTRTLVPHAPGQSGNALLMGNLMRDGRPGPDLRLQETPEGWLHLDTRGLRHFQLARLHAGRIATQCRQGEPSPAALQDWSEHGR